MTGRRLRKFKGLIKENFEDVLGQDLSLDLCWTLYKTAIVTALQFLMGEVNQRDPGDMKLVIRGLGTWKIVFRRARSIAGRPSKLLGRTKFVPYFRFVPSSRFRRILVKTFCGIDEDAIPSPGGSESPEG